VKLLAPFVANDDTIFAIVGLLIVWAGLSANRLYWRTESLISNLRRGRALVEAATDPRAFADSFESAPDSSLSLVRSPEPGQRSATR
jgi:hypothetical protein